MSFTFGQVCEGSSTGDLSAPRLSFVARGAGVALTKDGLSARSHRPAGVPVLAPLLLKGSTRPNHLVRDSRYVICALVRTATAHHAIQRGQLGRRPRRSGGVEAKCRGRNGCDTRRQVRRLAARSDQLHDFGFEGFAAGETAGGDQPCGIDGPIPLDGVQDLHQRGDIG